MRGLTVSRNGQFLFTCGDDKTIKQFRFDPNRGQGRHDHLTDGGGGSGRQGANLRPAGRDQAPMETWLAKSGGLSAIDHVWNGAPRFVTASTVVDARRRSSCRRLRRWTRHANGHGQKAVRTTIAKRLHPTA